MVDPSLVLAGINTVVLAAVSVMGYRLNRLAKTSEELDNRIVEVVRRELISGPLSDVLDLKLKVLVDRLDELDRKVNYLVNNTRGDRDE